GDHMAGLDERRRQEPAQRLVVFRQKNMCHQATPTGILFKPTAPAGKCRMRAAPMVNQFLRYSIPKPLRWEILCRFGAPGGPDEALVDCLGRGPGSALFRACRGAGSLPAAKGQSGESRSQTQAAPPQTSRKRAVLL